MFKENKEHIQVILLKQKKNNKINHALLKKIKCI
jgi:hypothetical protein